MTDLAVTASRLLAKFGEPVTLTDGAAVEYDPITGDAVLPPAGSTVTLNGYPSRYDKSEVDGTNIRSSDTRLILEVGAVRPLVGWLATVDGVTYRLMDVRPVRRSGSDKVLICQARAN